MELSWLLWLLPHFTLGLLIGVLAGLPVLLYVVALYVSKNQSVKREKYRNYITRNWDESSDEADPVRPLLVGFFHPYCNAGGGGERVLWQAVAALQKKYPRAYITIYTGDPLSEHKGILERVKTRFALSVSSSSVRFFHLSRRWAVEAKSWPRFTLLGQSLGSVWMASEILEKDHAPDIFVDSMGYAFTFPLLRFLGACKVAAYVHYPTISTDMISLVANREGNFNNAEFISRNPVFSCVKWAYYRMFAFLYGLVGRCCDGTLVNSSWTQGHIRSLWTVCPPPQVLFPPCDVSHLLPEEGSTEMPRKNTIVSVAQFRPEKNHRDQITAFHLLVKATEHLPEDCRLLLIGGARNEEDVELVHRLEDQAAELDVADRVEFHVNIPFDQLRKHLQEATVAIHTMKNEHFGIGIVECMAAGAITVAHNSGGPKLDIIDNKRTGFLCSLPEEYADVLRQLLLEYSESDREHVRDAARSSVSRFSSSHFEQGFLQAFEGLLLMPSSD